MKTLEKVFKKIGHFGNDIGCNDKGSLHSYLDQYERILAPKRNGCKLLEIGLALGDSIKLWDEYLENSEITGVDITVVFTPGEYKNKVNIIQADATNANFLKMIHGQTFDVIIDDGSHMLSDQIRTFNLLKPYMNPGGYYIIEDILNLEMSYKQFLAQHEACQIVDLRKVKGRFDDVLIIYSF